MNHEEDTPTREAVSTKEIPRLSPSIAKILVNRSPAHAYAAHRLLGGGGDDESTKAQNVGKILEALVYNQDLEENFAILPFDDFRKNDAKEARDAAIAEKKTPVLEKDVDKFQTAAIMIKRQLRDQGIVFEGGEYQKLIEWTCSLTGANCKGYIDYFSPTVKASLVNSLKLQPSTEAIIWDLKCVDNASPDKVRRAFDDYGWDIAMAAYIEGIETLYPDLISRVPMVFPFAETAPPYLVHLYNPGAEMLTIGQERWHHAKQRWAECMEKNEWPGYFVGVHRLEPTAWAMARFQEKLEIAALSAEVETEEAPK